jgi:predicted HTH domain antitoxin
MAVTVHLPADVEQKLRAESPNLDSDAKEAMLVELYRQDKLTHHELSRALGLERFETDAVLKQHKVTEDLPTDKEYDDALTRLGMLRSK